MKKVAVIGAGAMGAGIAAQIANAGVPVLLLDRMGVAAAALERLAKIQPPPFMGTQAARLVQTGDSDTELDRIVGCDWILEAVSERLDVKQALYRRIDAARGPDAAVSSSTSTFTLAQLVDGMPEAFARAFLITHFFAPPRHMRLLEMVAGPRSDPALVERVRAFCDVALGKTAVACSDTPGFIANRIGAHWLRLGVDAARDLGLSIEQADAAMGKPAGLPATGVFGLIDLIGPALTPRVGDDVPGKGGDGFYRLDRTGDGTAKQALDLVTGEYRPRREVALAERDLRALLGASGNIGEYARRVFGGTLAFAAASVPEIATDITAIDAAMRLGYNWKRGPFEMIDVVGIDVFAEQLRQAGVEPPPLLQHLRPFYRIAATGRQCLGVDGTYRDVARAPGVLLLDDVKARSTPLLRNASAALWDIGDGVACFEMTSKMGSFDLPIMELLHRTIEVVGARFGALVIGHDGDHFSAGANLSLMLAAANDGDWDALDRLVVAGQCAFKALKYAPFPVVAAPAGLALGGGCEIVLHADAVQAHAETTIGLVECSVGLIPGWGGCGEMLDRLRDHGGSARAFDQIRAATTAKSAAEAKELLYLRPGDGITMNRDRVLADAKARALSMVDGYAPPPPPSFDLPGPPGDDAMVATVRDASDYDVTVAAALAGVLSGGETDPAREVREADLLDLERIAFVGLLRNAPTRARIEHTLATGKPLRN